METPSKLAGSFPSQKPPLFPKGLDAFAFRVQGAWKRFRFRSSSLLNQADGILDQANRFSSLSDPELDHLQVNIRSTFQREGLQNPTHCAEALALLIEYSDRTLKLRPHPVQVAGTLGLLHGYMVELATGEGKTLTLALAAILAAWQAKPCHVLTANDYLASRDAKRMRSLFNRCGISSSYIVSTTEAVERRRAYEQSVVYTTTRELVADFLRDRLTLEDDAQASLRIIRQMEGNPRPEQAVLNGLHFVLVDEADSLMVDEAVTPLIISQKQENSFLNQAVEEATVLAGSMKRQAHFQVDETFQVIDFDSAGRDYLAGLPVEKSPILRNPRWREHFLRDALSAREFYHHDQQYLIRDGKILIIDENTGRVMPDRNWQMGIHQAIEIKEGLTPSEPSQTMASISFQQFFRMVPKLAGVTGTAWENRGEFWQVYAKLVFQLPTHKPTVRTKYPSRYYSTRAEKWTAVVEAIRTEIESGRSVLVGTRTVESSEALAWHLEKAQLPFALLNARQDEAEAEIISRAGQQGQVTIATNMAGRGTDIQLSQETLAAGGLHVILTEPHEAKRIDRQFMGRAARQGDPGSVQYHFSLEDRVIQKFCPQWLRPVLKRSRKILLPVAGGVVRLSQRKAEAFNFRQRVNVLRQDRWFAEHL